jgi:hypothetical protein
MFLNFTQTELEDLVGKSIESDFATKEGISYSLSFNISINEKGIISVSGKIHDKNSFKFELLEETLILDV